MNALPAINMFIPKEEIKFQWWHNLIRMIIWFITAFVFYLTLLEIIKGSVNFSIFYNPLITYLSLTFFYRYIILYIIYG
jgi:uncharacterized RDD family membrane protein YckC